jgi:hypothetical protein
MPLTPRCAHDIPPRAELEFRRPGLTAKQRFKAFDRGGPTALKGGIVMSAHYAIRSGSDRRQHSLLSEEIRRWGSDRRGCAGFDDEVYRSLWSLSKDCLKKIFPTG